MQSNDAAAALARSLPGRRRRWLSRMAGAVALVLVAAGAALGVASLTTERWYWSRILAWRGAAFDDFARKFEARPIPNGPTVSALAAGPATLPKELETVAVRSAGGEKTEPLLSLLERTDTRALLIVKNDRLLYEGYFNGADHNATMTSFSLAKSLLSAVFGIAIAEGKVGLDEPVTRYLTELSGRPGLDAVKVRHLLGMASGLRYNGNGFGSNPWGDDARAYYEPDLRAFALTAEAGVSPGTRWEYNNFHPLLLGMILERATGTTVSAYVSEKLWKPLGAEAAASWSLDSRRSGFEKMESGFNARAVDFARFGRLFLRGGAVDGRQIVPRAWVEASTRHDPLLAGPATSPPGEEWARALDYGYLWWIDPKAPGRYFAQGNLGQVLYVAPDRDVVVVRFGGSFGGVSWPAIARDIAGRL